MLESPKTKKTKKFKDHLIQREDILHHQHSGSTFSEREVNIVLLIILAVIAMLFWMPLAEFLH